MNATVDIPASNWVFPTQILFGAGRIKELPQLCDRLGIHRPMIVTDPVLAGLEALRAVVDENEGRGLPTTVFSDIKGNPVGRNVTDGVAAYRANRADGVIAIGGGSSLDAAKVIALMVDQSRPLWDFRVPAGMGITEVGKVAPVIAVPTTAGTGSEVNRAGLIVDESTRQKVIIAHPQMMPAAVICDPTLSIGMPAHLTAATGMDALAHNVEAICSPAFNPMGEGMGYEGARLVHDNLLRACRDGTDLGARAGMMAAATTGSAAFTIKGLGAIHAISHPVGALFDTHHGLTNAVVFPYVLVRNRPAIEARMARLAAFIGLPEAGFDGVLAWILSLRRELRIPHSLAELGVPQDAAARLAPLALADLTNHSNPVRLDESAYRSLIDDCIHGRLAA